jgi:hypothetical protein
LAISKEWHDGGRVYDRQQRVYVMKICTEKRLACFALRYREGTFPFKVFYIFFGQG